MKRKIHRCFLSLILIFSVLIAHLSTVMHNESILAVGLSQSTRTMVIATGRGTIYDRHITPLNYSGSRYCGVLVPELKQLNSIRNDMQDAEYDRLKGLLKQRKLLIASLTKASITSPQIRTFEIPIPNNGPMPAAHLIGSLDDSEQVGLSGIQKGYNTVLNQYSGKISVTYPVNGAGEYQSDGQFKVTNTISRCTGGVQLTLDIKIQQILDELTPQYLSKGIVTILDAETSELIACTGTPTLPDDENPLLTPYPCDLAFKIVTAAAALENGFSIDETFHCTGQMTVGDTNYLCSNPIGHHLLNLEGAFTRSCDLYFIQLAEQIGYVTLNNTAENLGLFNPIELAENLVAPATSLPKTNERQRGLKTTPFHMAQLSAVIENGGILTSLTAILGTVDVKGTQTPTKRGRGVRALSENTTTVLKQIMKHSNLSPSNSWYISSFTNDNTSYVITIWAETIAQEQTGLQEFVAELTEQFNNA